MRQPKTRLAKIGEEKYLHGLSFYHTGRHMSWVPAVVGMLCLAYVNSSADKAGEYLIIC